MKQVKERLRPFELSRKTFLLLGAIWRAGANPPLQRARGWGTGAL